MCCRFWEHRRNIEITTGAAISVTGTLVESKGAGQNLNSGG
jgi:hypothetical protein